MPQKGFAHVFLLIILLVGIIGGVYLVTSGNPLKLFSRASDKPIIEAVDQEGKPLPIDQEKGMAVIKKRELRFVLNPPNKQKDNVIKSKTVLFQTLLDNSGQNLISRKCNVDNSRVEWEKCTQWVDAATDSIKAPEGLMGTLKYRSFDSFVLEDIKPVVYQSLIAESGEEGYTRNCLIHENSFGVVLDHCSPWSTVDFRSLRKIGNEKYRSLNSYLIEESENKVLKQSLVSESGQEGYARSCPIDTNGSFRVNWDNCSDWQLVDFTNLQGQGNESYFSVSSFIIPNNNGQSTLNQSLIDQSGKKGLARICPIREEGIIWGECGGWSTIDLGDLRGTGGGEAYLSIANYPVTFKEEIISPKVEITHYQVSENQNDLINIHPVPVSQAGITGEYIFSDLKPGKKILYVKLTYSDGSTINGSLDVYQATESLYYRMPELESPQINGDYDGGNTTYYDIEGSTPQELMTEMDKKGPAYFGAEKDKWGYTFWHWSWSWAGACIPEVTLDIGYILPRWKNYSDAPQALKEQWDKFYNSLQKHEKGHAALANLGAQAIRDNLIGSGCSNAAAYQVIDQVNAQQREYDRKSSFK